MWGLIVPNDQNYFSKQKIISCVAIAILLQQYHLLGLPKLSCLYAIQIHSTGILPSIPLYLVSSSLHHSILDQGFNCFSI